MSDVNPHYLDRVVKLSETSDIGVSEDIVELIAGIRQPAQAGALS